MTPIVAIATFLKGWTVYHYDARITPIFHTDALRGTPRTSPFPDRPTVEGAP